MTGDEDLDASLEDLGEMLDEETACLIVQNPDFFGELPRSGRAGGSSPCCRGAAGGGSQPDPQPGDCSNRPASTGRISWSAEGQPFGAGLNFGGPYLGVFAATMKNVRKMPGTAGGRDSRHGRPARLCADPLAARAAHPARKSDQQHLHQPGT